jgi:type I restriction enzyme S subunit
MKWPEVNLDQVLSLDYGSALPKRRRNSSGTIPVVGSNGIIGTHTESIVIAPSIVVGRKGSAGKVSWIDQDFWPIDTTFYVRPLVPIEMRWLFYLLDFLKIERLAIVTGVPGLNRNDAYKLKIPLPPLSEQRKIVEILDRADALRKKRAEADAKAERILPALFIKMFGDPALNPRGWPDKTLDDIIIETKYGTSTRANTDGKGVPVLRMNNIDSRGRLDLTKLKYVDLKAQKLSKYELKSGDLLFNRTNSRELVGKTGLWQGEIKAIPASYLIRVRVDQTKVLPEYVWAYMNTPFLKQILYDTARRSIGMANINAQELRSLPILIPPDLESQQPFTEMIARLDLLTVKQAADANAKLDNLFELLLHRAFSGELTTKWREEHKEQLQAEMEEQAKILAASKAKQKTKRRRRRASPK